MFVVPQIIPLEDLSESKSTLEEKSADCSLSVTSVQTVTHETTNVALYEVVDTKTATLLQSIYRQCLKMLQFKFDHVQGQFFFRLTFYLKEVNCFWEMFWQQ